MSWLPRLVPSKQHQHIDGDVTPVDEAEAMIRAVFGPGVVEVSRTEEAEVVVAGGRLRRTA